MKIDPILTAHPVTGAVRHITADLLGATYLAPRMPAFDLTVALQQGPSPWRDSFTAAPAETAMAIERGIVALARATKTLSPEAIEMRDLPDGRARRHLSALGDLWRQMGDALPDDLGILAHVLHTDATQAVEALPVLDPTVCAFADPVEAALIEKLIVNHGSAPLEALAAWLSGRVSPHVNATGALGHLQMNLTETTAPVDPDGSLAVFGLRDPIEEAAFAAACTRQMLDSGVISAPQDVGLLIPDDAIYLEHLAQSFDALGLPLAGLAIEPATRDHVGISPGQRLSARQARTAPLVAAFGEWLQAQRRKISSKSRLGEKLTYIHNHWDGLQTFLQDGRVEIDNNRVENLIRPIALNRKNALFAGHDEGGIAWGHIASLIETCKINGIEPFAYLRDTLKAIANGHPQSRLDDLLPWNFAPSS